MNLSMKDYIFYVVAAYAITFAALALVLIKAVIRERRAVKNQPSQRAEPS
jgi:heme exporter protein CcmD